MKTYLLTARSSRLNKQVAITPQAVAPFTKKEMLDLTMSRKDVTRLYHEAQRPDFAEVAAIIRSSLRITSVETRTVSRPEAVPNPRKRAIRVLAVSRPKPRFTANAVLRVTFNTTNHVTACEPIWKLLDDMPFTKMKYEYGSVVSTVRTTARSIVDLRFAAGTDLRELARKVWDTMGAA